MASISEMTKAVERALAGDWDGAHKIVQPHEDDKTACWIHGVLHKIEGDDANARYWYRRSDYAFEAFSDPTVELGVIKGTLTY